MSIIYMATTATARNSLPHEFGTSQNALRLQIRHFLETNF